jgi:large subunit ribosomal protein L7Ae
MAEINDKEVFTILQKAKESGKVKIGINEVTKAIERKVCKFVVYANDVSPAEIVAHLSGLSKEMGILCVSVGTKQELGALLNIKSTAAICVIDSGSAKAELETLIMSQKKTEKVEKKVEETKEEKVEEKKE